MNQQKTGIDSSRRTQLRPVVAQDGFTLLEVLLAITIAGFVLAAASTMLVSVSNIWANRQQNHFFDDHADGVAEFLQACFIRAGSEVALGESGEQPGAPNSGQSNDDGSSLAPRVGVTVGDNSGTRRLTPGVNQDKTSGSDSHLLRLSDQPISWGKPPGAPAYQDPFLNFKLAPPPPLLVSANGAPIGRIDVFLHFDEKEGLSLLWNSTLQEKVEDENDLRRTQISPYVKAMKFVYWDERFSNWEEDNEPREGETDEFLLPRFIRLTFQKDDITTERTITLPVGSRSALLF